MVEDDAVLDFLLQFARQFWVELYLSLPYLLKLILIVFAIESLALDALQRVERNLTHQVLTNRLMIVCEQLAPARYSCQIFAHIFFIGIYFTLATAFISTFLVDHEQHSCQFAKRDFLAGSLRT